MSSKIDEEVIKGLSQSHLEMLGALTSEKRSGFATIKDLVAATRRQAESTYSSRAEYFTFALGKLREQDPRVGDSFALHFISTLDKTCSVVDIGAGPVILIDLHQSRILEDLGLLYLAEGPIKRCEAMALCLLAEQFIASGMEEEGNELAVRRSMLMKDEELPELDIQRQSELERLSAVQDVFILTHEVGHILWSRDQVPKQRFIAEATRWIALDTFQMGQIDANLRPTYENVRSLRAQLGAQSASGGADAVLSIIEAVAEKSGYSHEQIGATLRRRCDPAGGFIEELWADYYAWVSCMQLFSGHWSAEEVYRNLTLALRNVATIDAFRRLAERDADPQTYRRCFNAPVSTQKRVAFSGGRSQR